VPDAGGGFTCMCRGHPKDRELSRNAEGTPQGRPLH
jgi:hypothetical protein